MSWGQNYFVSTDWQEILPPKMTKNPKFLKCFEIGNRLWIKFTLMHYFLKWNKYLCKNSYLCIKNEPFMSDKDINRIKLVLVEKKKTNKQNQIICHYENCLTRYWKESFKLKERSLDSKLNLHKEIYNTKKVCLNSILGVGKWKQ